MKQNKITPSLWYHTSDGRVKSVTDYYSRIFDKQFEAGETIPLGDTPSGYTEMCYVKLFGNPYLIMTTSVEHHKLNDSFSIILNCDGQAEIDKYWDYFTSEGKESQCGWCVDKYGLRWQIVPENLDELLSRPNAWEVMGNQTKIIIEEYFK
ncbi:MAG: VOC family protein [Bacteroidales bacterium]